MYLAWSGEVIVPDSLPAKAELRQILPASLKDGELATLRIGNRRIRVEVASTPQSREHGLMQRDYLCDDCGMLFVFEKPDKYSFWMKDTLLPLSIAFVAADGSIINIDEMRPYTTEPHNSREDALYALEMSSGWFTKNSITIADKLQGLKPATKAK
jgi:uncharacterized membrane protein (UPF0127 family)